MAQYYVSQGSTLGAYAYNTQGGGELLSPDSGQKQFRRLTQMFAGLTPGPPEQDLLRSVEWCKSFLFRLRPQVFIITRLDAHYPRPGEDAEQLDRFTTAVTRLTALRARSRRGGRVRVIHVNPPSPTTGRRFRRRADGHVPMGDARHDDGVAAGRGGCHGLGSLRRAIYHNTHAAHGQIPMSIFPSSLTGRLLLAEVVLLTTITVIALWVMTESVRYADQTRTMWPSFLLEHRRLLCQYARCWLWWPLPWSISG